MSELLRLYRNAQIPYEKFIRYCAIAPVGILPYYDGLLDQYSEADQIFVKRVLELEAKYSALTARIAELEAEIDRLIEAGNALSNGIAEAEIPFYVLSEEILRLRTDWKLIVDSLKGG